MKPSEIRAKPDKELVKILGEKRAELLVLQLKRVTGQLAKTADVRKTKRDIARMITIMRQKAKGNKDVTK